LESGEPAGIDDPVGMGESLGVDPGDFFRGDVDKPEIPLRR
jgi:hypothetical protein